MAAVRFYSPVSDGAFADIVDELGRAGASCMAERPSFVRCTWHGARFVIVHDPDGVVRAQLVDDAGLGARAWDAIDSVLTRSTSTHTGWGSAERVGAFFYDADLAKFGNAFSPFVQTSSQQAATLALQRPFEDRYNPRYDGQTWDDWQRWTGGEGWGSEWASEWVGAAGQASGGAIDAIDKKALVATGAIALLTVMFALRNKRHWLEITAAGAGGVALVWGMGTGHKLTPR
jgi:hypothetical protein